MKIRILDVAERDLIEGYHFYEKQLPGLGQYFLDSIYTDIESLYLYYGIHPQHFGYHRLLARRFPFAIYYRIEDKSIRIYAVLDCRQDPAAAIKRLN
jgi:plasmid stabilization system protein ParE